jgi:hypothetical protein
MYEEVFIPYADANIVRNSLCTSALEDKHFNEW